MPESRQSESVKFSRLRPGEARNYLKDSKRKIIKAEQETGRGSLFYVALLTKYTITNLLHCKGIASTDYIHPRRTPHDSVIKLRPLMFSTEDNGFLTAGNFHGYWTQNLLCRYLVWCAH